MQNKSRAICTELDEVLVFVATAIKLLKDGTPWVAVLQKILPAFAKALAGSNMIPNEFLADPVGFFQTLGMRLGEIYADLKAAREITPLAKSRAIL